MYLDLVTEKFPNSPIYVICIVFDICITDPELILMYGVKRGLLGGASGKESACQCRRHKRCRFDFLHQKIPWSRKCHPTPVSLPGKFHG